MNRFQTALLAGVLISAPALAAPNPPKVEEAKATVVHVATYKITGMT